MVASLTRAETWTVNSSKLISAGWYVSYSTPLFCSPIKHHVIIIHQQVAEGTARTLIRSFDVKKREYFGNTSMEAEISLLMANQTQVRPSPVEMMKPTDRAVRYGRPHLEGSCTTPLSELEAWPTCVLVYRCTCTRMTRRREQTTAYFGAHVYGSDIDGRQMRGKGATSQPLVHVDTLS